MPEDVKSMRLGRKLPEGIRSKYELVVAAAKEAERLNDVSRHRGGESAEKVTMLALKRIERGLSKIVHEEAEKPGDEAQRRETTFFFGS